MPTRPIRPPAVARLPGGDVALATALSVFLVGLSVAALVVVRSAERDRMLSRAFEASVALENLVKWARPGGPDEVRRAVGQFQAEGVTAAALVGPGRRVIAHTDPLRVGEIQEDPRIDAALATDEVQSGYGPDGAFEVFIPVLRGGPPGPGPGPGPGHLRQMMAMLEAGHGPPPREVVLRMGLVPGPSGWLWHWVWAQAAASAAVIAALWTLVYRSRRQAAALAAAEAHRQRREVLARLGGMSAVLAHEIRNPLAAAKGHVQLAAEATARGGGAAEVSGRLGTAVSEVERVEALVRGLLDYARDRPLQRAHRTLDAVIDRGVALARHGAPAAGATIQRAGETGVALECDEEQLGRAVGNLVQNALEAAGPSGRVRVTTSRSGGHAVVTVEDSGPGVPADVAPRAFEPFVTGKVRGVGLGLAVVRQVAEAHGGDVELGRSADLGGARFVLRVPGGTPGEAA